MVSISFAHYMSITQKVYVLPIGSSFVTGVHGNVCLISAPPLIYPVSSPSFITRTMPSFSV